MSSPQPIVTFAFNGDADGIISQHLVKISGIMPANRITGLKRDLKLLARLPASGTSEPLDLHVFDINLRDNLSDLLRLLENPATTVRWHDHHEPGEIPPALSLSGRFAHRIVTARGTCTALLTHADYPGADPRWAAMAAYGDNIPEAAEALLKPLGLHPLEVREICEAGELVNYNAYGEDESDVLFQPLEVAERMAPFTQADKFIRESGLIGPLRDQFRDDQHSMGGLVADEELSGAALYRLPDAAWARRLGSTFANRAALADPGRAIAALHPLRDGSFQVSIRAPRGRKDAAAASTLASEFPSGGGRALAAGINQLPASDVDRFARRFFETYRA
ncbi:MAG TPA: hypothetical protein VHO02_04120 [Fibrobacteria bacterium]|nr:hypothetical protein [Fibrobacteria bacterium]